LGARTFSTAERGTSATIAASFGIVREGNVRVAYGASFERSAGIFPTVM
jgi:hypothetical protein